MIVYPAIDLIGGQCVRLEEGDFDRTTTYDATPIDVAHSYRDAGAAWMHVVDLDGAKAGRPAQTDVIASLAAVDGLSVQAGGGVRALDDVLALLEAGVSRVVVGSLCVKEPDLVKSWIASLGAGKLTLALDVRPEGGDFKIATHGWQETSDVSLFDVVADFVTAGRQHFLVTDISRDGMLEGVNVDLMATLQSRFPDVEMIASGGVASLDDVTDLNAKGVKGVIIGKALYEGRFSAKEALDAGA